MMGWFGVAWFLTSIVYYVNRCSMDYKEKILKKLGVLYLRKENHLKIILT